MVAAGAAAGAVAVGAGTLVVGGGIIAGLAGLQILFSKDPFIRHLENGMSENQREMFQREIEDWKYSEGRGGADNLTKDLLRKIAEIIKYLYK